MADLWSQYYASQGRSGPILADTELDKKMRMEDCDIFECSVASMGRKAYGFMRRIGEEEGETQQIIE